jgi:hypothetical protein
MFTVNAGLTHRSVSRTIASLTNVDARVARAALRKGVFRAGSETVKQSKAAAPRGRTGQFRRSLAKKDIRYAATATYVSLVGQRRNRQYTSRQIASANRKTGLLSKGLSGRGKAPPIHWIEAGTKQHTINPRGGNRLWWNVVRGGVLLARPRSAMKVTHPGHAGTDFLFRTEVRYRQQRIKTVQREMLREIVRLRQ